MKRVRNAVIAIGMVVSTTIGLTSCTFIERTESAKGKQVVAKIGDTEIKRSEIEDEVKSAKDQLKKQYGDNYLENDEVIKQLNQAKQSKLDNMVYIELVKMYIKDKKIKVDDAKKQEFIDENVNYYKERLQATDDKDFEEKAKKQLGVSVDEMKKVLGDMYLTNCAVDHFMESKTDDDVKKYKKDSKAEYETKSKQKAVFYIVNKDKAQMEEAKKEIDAGKTISEIASKYTTDAGKESNGFFGFVDTESSDMASIDANFVNTIKGLEQGQTSDIVESAKDEQGNLQFGYFIIGVSDTDTGIKYELKKNALSAGIYDDLKKIYKGKFKIYEKKLKN